MVAMPTIGKNASDNMFESHLPGFTTLEDLMIWKGFLAASQDKKAGNNPACETFQRKMYKSYQKYFHSERKNSAYKDSGIKCPLKMRTPESVRNRFKNHVGPDIVKFVAIMEEQQEDQNKSEEECYRECLLIYKEKYGRDFGFNLRKEYFENKRTVNSLISSSIASESTATFDITTLSDSTPSQDEELQVQKAVTQMNQIQSRCEVLPTAFCFPGDIYVSAARVGSAIYSGRIFQVKAKKKSRKRRRSIPRNRNFTTEEYLNHLAKKEEDASSEEKSTSYFAPRATEKELKKHEKYYEEKKKQPPPVNLVHVDSETSVSQLENPTENLELVGQVRHLDDSMYPPDEEDDLFALLGSYSEAQIGDEEAGQEVGIPEVNSRSKPNIFLKLPFLTERRRNTTKRIKWDDSCPSNSPMRSHFLFGSATMLMLFCLTGLIVLVEKPWENGHKAEGNNVNFAIGEKVHSSTATLTSEERTRESAEEFILDHSPNIVGDLDRARLKHRIKSMQTLDFTDRNISGPLPTGIGTLTQLTELRIINSRLSGELPTELGLLSNLQFLDLSNNWITGTLPTEIGRLTQLRLFDVANNNMTGTLPDSEYINLRQVKRFDISNNHFEGSLPTLWTGWNQLKIISFQDNHWSPDSRLPDQPYGENLQFIHLDRMRKDSIPDSYCTDLSFLNAIRISCPENQESKDFFILNGLLPCDCCVC